MTVRAVLLGFAGVLFLALFTFFNDKVIGGNDLTGHFVPFAVFGILVCAVLFINPLLGRLRRKLAFSGAELAVAASISLFACFVPGRGLMQFFNNAIMMPHHHARVRPSWRGDAVQLRPDRVKSWPAFADALARGRRESAGACRRSLWAGLPAKLQKLLEARETGAVVPAEARSGICEAVGEYLKTRVDWREPVRQDGLNLPAYLRRLLDEPAGETAGRGRERLNRGMLDLLCAGTIHPRRPGPVESAPAEMLADVDRQSDSRVLDGFVTGLAEGDQTLPVSEVPWGAWLRPWLFWMPLVLAISAAVIGLSLVFHRQWVDNEHLPYPTVQFVHELLPEEGGLMPAVLRNRWFWAGLSVVLLVHLNNYAARWWPQALMRIPTYIDLRPLQELLPGLQASNKAQILVLRLDFAAFGFAYLLARDVSFSLGIAPWIYWMIMGYLVSTFGIDLSAQYGTFNPGLQPSLHAGAYVAMFVLLVMAARGHLAAAFRRGLWLGPPSDDVPEHEAWGVRAFLAGTVCFVVLLAWVGLPLWLGLLYACGAIVIFTVVSRMLAEGGVFTTQSCWYAGALLWGFLGARFIGPDRMLIMGIVSSVLLITYREVLMGFSASALQLSGREGVRPGRIALSGGLAVAVALVIAGCTTLYLQYSHGSTRTGDVWTLENVPCAPYENDVAIRNRLASQDLLGESLAGKSGSLANIAPHADCVIAFALVVAFTWLRRRFPWWPLHPLMFLVLGTNDAVLLSGSFLAGGTVKSLAQRYGGWKVCNNLKPIIVGLIAGEMFVGILTAVIGIVYYFVTGEPPVRYKVFLG